MNDIEVIGWYNRDIFLRYKGKKVSMKNTLPRTELILRLGVHPQEVKATRDQIQVVASSKPMSYFEVEGFWRDP